jgi:ligand-binding sensor domain-containing protein
LLSTQSSPQPTTSVRRLRRQTGLPSNVVNDVLQTRDGFLIVGAAPGLLRFDGHHFAEMNSDPPKEIIALSLAEGPDGDLWGATPRCVYRFPHAETDQRRKESIGG